ncbi:thioesterase-like superfamily-domain-containing protein [Podospora australis]|uniref:Thioesterase-like superfamily-domain-containing protein n=1 Tax=Podospora australis TaxID=1536484 RepID=A0AAN6WSQ1_9PEZI|nr:thioesterase-like superfamily-domain-containing protein [Podospora australis]
MATSSDPRLSFQEQLELIKLPSDGAVRRYVSTRAPYLPGQDFSKEKEMPSFHTAAFGGHVYAQAGLAAYRTWREIEEEKGTKDTDRLDIHTINGYFTRPGLSDRPFLYTSHPLTSSRSFSTVSVTAYQPVEPSAQGDFYTAADASKPLSPPAFTALLSFKLPEDDSEGVSSQEPPPQERFADILSSRKPEEWLPAPPVDITAVVSLVGADQVGTFPIVDMKKVDMTAYNEGKPVHERREILLYRLLKPLPSNEDGKTGYDANAHVLTHAFVADRNGLLMAGNHIGFGWSLGRAASLSYHFVMHVEAEAAVMREQDGWWVQEVWFPRSGRGRGIVESKIWSPKGVHVASEYQDGLIQGFGGKGKTIRQKYGADAEVDAKL